LTFIRVSTDMISALRARYALHVPKMFHGTVTL